MAKLRRQRITWKYYYKHQPEMLVNQAKIRANQRMIVKEVKKEVEEELKNNPFVKEDMNEKVECEFVGKMAKLSTLNDNGVCQKCVKDLEEDEFSEEEEEE